jgi:hypothetical protein
MQLNKLKRRYSAKYENGLWNDTKARYDAEKREYREVLKILKKMRHYLYNVRFVIEINVKTLVA